MNRNKLGAHGLKLVVILLILACADCKNNHTEKAIGSEQVKSDRLEVYYRSFNQLTPISLSARDLESSAPVRIIVTERSAVDSLLKATNMPCRPTDQTSEEKMDVYIYIKKFYRGKSVGIWKASPFHFYAHPSDGTVCLLEKTERDYLGNIIEKLAQE